MAQITTEKRTTPAMRPHTAPIANSGATKENARHHNASSPSRGKGIEILDFHESWLEEVQLYKDKMVMCKELSHHNHQSVSQSSQKSRNFNSNNNHSNPRRLHNQIRSSAGNSTTKSPTKNPNHHKSSSSQVRQKTTDATAAAVATAAPATKSPPPRITPKLNSVPAPVVGVLQSEPYKKVQVRIHGKAVDLMQLQLIPLAIV